MGRPTKLTPRVHKAIVTSVQNGNYIETAILAAGIAKQTFYNWKARGEEGGKGNAIYVDFLDALTSAEAEAEERAVQALTGGFSDDWRAASEYLRRKHPDRWSTQDRITHSGKVEHSGKFTHEVTERIDADIDELLEGVVARGETATSDETSR